MAQVINTNALSMVAQNNLNKSQGSLGTAIQRLSSGLRINSAKAMPPVRPSAPFHRQHHRSVTGIT